MSLPLTCDDGGAEDRESYKLTGGQIDGRGTSENGVREPPTRPSNSSRRLTGEKQV